MTHDDDIPELLHRLEGRLGSPSPDAIRTEASRRRAVRKRMANTAGVLALIVTIAGSALWFTRDTATTTATVAEDAVDSLDPADQPAVADDSAPVSASPVSLLRDLGPLSIMIDYSEDERTPFLPRDLQAFVSFLLPEVESTTSTDKSGMWFSNGCQADAYFVEWTGTGFTVGEQIALPPNQGLVGGTLCEQPSVQPVLKSRISPGQFVAVEHDPSKSVFVLRSDGFIRDSNGERILSDTVSAWTLSLVAPKQLPISTPPTTGPAPLNAQGVVRMDDNCINFTHLQLRDHGWFIVSDPPLEWQGRPSFDVAVELDAAGGFVATDRDGLSATFALDVDEAQSRSCRRWVTPTPREALPTIDAHSVDDCITGFNGTAAVSTIINGPGENETAWASFQEAEDWEGRTDVCWIAVSTDAGCRSYAWFRTLGREPGKFQENPPLDPDQPCVGNGTQFDEDSAR